MDSSSELSAHHNRYCGISSRLRGLSPGYMEPQWLQAPSSLDLLSLACCIALAVKKLSGQEYSHSALLLRN
jgi:hypothetical protein